MVLIERLLALTLCWTMYVMGLETLAAFLVSTWKLTVWTWSDRYAKQDNWWDYLVSAPKGSNHDHQI